ncbi:MAG: inositol monophosphatase [Bacteroidales bacterium]|nr:inositol monophosphatase [Bacteroidales bacterium]
MEYIPELNLRQIESRVIGLCRHTASFILEQSRKIGQDDIERKGLHDYVTYVDKTAEKRLVEGLEEILPQAGFIAEEGTATRRGERYDWIVDPLDGTTNFIHGIPFYCISIALQDKQTRTRPDGEKAIPEGEVILGVVHHIDMDEIFHAVWGGQACLNGNPIHVSTMETLDNSLILTGFPYYDFGRLDGYMKLLAYLMQHTAGIRRLGSAALDLAAVAAGRSEVFFEYGLRPWDVAAGQFLVKQAGGKVFDFQGGPNYLHGKEIACGNPSVLQSFMPLLQQFLPQDVIKKR